MRAVLDTNIVVSGLLWRAAPRQVLDADPEIEEAWAAEVERRQAQLESGTAGLHPGPETLAKLKAEFR